MESLRPDREDLDQFKSRNQKPAKSASVKQGRQSAKVVKPVREKSRVIPLLVLVLLSGVFVWAYLDQQEKMLVMQEELEGTSDFIGRSKLLMARFEGELNVTGTELEQSGSAVQSKLAFLDDQMRKLWVVSNERNKAAIKDNDTRLSQIQTDVKATIQWREKFEQATKSSQLKQNTILNGLSLQSSVIQGEWDKLDGRVLLLANEVTIIREEHSESLEVKRKELASLSKQLGESKKEISSINASRLQLNERVVGMERQINKLQLSIKSKVSDVQ
jgi:chromosome segregation ATPase